MKLKTDFKKHPRFHRFDEKFTFNQKRTEFTENRYKIAPSLKLTRVEFYSVNFFCEKMAEKFGVGSGPHELKIGSSFAANGKNGKFHTIRYDFKPASLDPTKSGVLDIGESNSLNVKLPHSNGTTETNYR